MRFDRFVRRWVGVALSLVAVVATGWLSVTGRLEFYIHPRYAVFTVIMAAIGGAAAVTAFLVVPSGSEHDHHDHEHDHDHDHGPDENDLLRRGPRRRAVLASVGAALTVGAAIVGLLVLPPATLSSSAAQSRDLTTGAGNNSDASPALVGGDTSAFTVKDWSSLLHQGLGTDYFTTKSVVVTGFIVPTDDPDVFYLARFVITCCAVDAQPVGVPVRLPGWRDQFAKDDWLQASGRFVENPDVDAAEQLVLVADLTPIDQPAQPYVY